MHRHKILNWRVWLQKRYMLCQHYCQRNQAKYWISKTIWICSREEKGEMKTLLLEAEEWLQLASNDHLTNIAEFLCKFVKIIAKQNVNGQLKIITNYMVNGILPLNDETMKRLQEQHPQEKLECQENIMKGDPPIIHPVIFEEIDEEMI